MPFRDRLIGGDSGNPAFLLINDQPILIYCLTGGWSGSGDGLHFYQDKIQSLMDELCPGYKLEIFDFGVERDEGWGRRDEMREMW